MSHWEKNTRILRQQYPGLLEELFCADEDFTHEIKIETASTGEISLCINGLHVHSPRDPVREAQRLVQAADKGSGPFVILGFGLGYAAQAASEAGRPVIIVEKHKYLLQKALEIRDLTGFLTKKNIIFIAGGTGDGILNALSIAGNLTETDEKTAPSVVRSKALADLDREWYAAIEKKIRIWTMRDDVNAATLKRFGRRWVRNLSRSMNAIRDFPGISRLSGLAALDEPLPVFLAAAGPSLDKTKPLLREIYRRCIVIAVDTSLRFFSANGIQPDFVLTVDPQFWNSRHLDRCICGRTVLIAESAVYPAVLRLPFRKIFLCGSLFPLGTFIEKQVDPKGALGAGGSVATTAWDFARSLGGRDIWIAGLDLAYPGLRTHFRGARFEEKANSESSRFNPAETWIVRALRDGNSFKARSSSGGQVLTDHRLSLYSAWFENQFRQNEQIHNFALFHEGLAISGLNAAETETLLALPDRRDEINRRLEAAFQKTNAEFYEQEEAQKRSQLYENAVSSLKQGLLSIKNAAEEGAAITQQSMKRRLNPSQQNKVMKDLDGIMQRITNSDAKEAAGFLFPPVEKEQENTGDAFSAYLKTSFRLFTSLAEAANFNLKNIIHLHEIDR